MYLTINKLILSQVKYIYIMIGIYKYPLQTQHAIFYDSLLAIQE